MELCHLVTGLSIGGHQGAGCQPEGKHPFGIVSPQMKRQSPNRFLIAQNIFEEFLFERWFCRRLWGWRWRRCCLGLRGECRYQDCRQNYDEAATRTSFVVHTTSPWLILRRELLAHDHNDERAGLDRPLRPAARSGGWSLGVLGGRKKHLFGFGIKGHGPRAGLG